MYYNLLGVELTFGMNVICNGQLYENSPGWLPRRSDKVTALNTVKIKGRNLDVKINVEDEFERLHPSYRKEENEPLQFSTPYQMRVTVLDFKNGRKLVFTAFIAKEINGALISWVKTWEGEIQRQETQPAHEVKPVELPKIEVNPSVEEIDQATAQKLVEEQLDHGDGKNGETRRSRDRRSKPEKIPIKDFIGKSLAEVTEA
jgi:hypothetical protein